MGIKSSKPSKQRKFFHNMPTHKRQKSLAANVSKPLRKNIGKRSLALRKGDRVKVMRGSHKGFEGKVSRTNYEKQQVFLEKLARKKNDGTEQPIPMQASNLMIVDIDKSDARRLGKEKEKKTKKEIKEETKEKKEDVKKPKPAKKAKKEKSKEDEKKVKGKEKKKVKVDKKKSKENEEKKVKTDGKKGRKKKSKKA